MREKKIVLFFVGSGGGVLFSEMARAFLIFGSFLLLVELLSLGEDGSSAVARYRLASVRY